MTSKNLVRPPRLAPGARVALVAPAGPLLERDDLVRAQALAVLLHLNRVIDRGIAVAVAGYTDALVAELYVQDGVPSAGNGLEPADVERHLSALERELVAVTVPPTGAI